MSSCCGTPEPKPSCSENEASAAASSSCCGPAPSQGGSCSTAKGRPDWMLWGSLFLCALLYVQGLFLEQLTPAYAWYQHLATGVFELMNTMWWGLLLGLLMVAVLVKVPREFVMSILGTRSGFVGILRATAAGVLLDLCNHGILMVGAKLYERGASAGQLMAFLIASPWNSLSLTFILVALIGLPWTLAFIVLSAIVAIIVGVIFDHCVAKGVLPANPNQEDLPEDFKFFPEAKKQLSAIKITPTWIKEILVGSVVESRMVLRWIFFGVLLASAIRAFVSPEHFGTYFGPSLIGLGLTIIAATIIEVCSEGSTPIAADLLTRAGAPGNSFAFLMTGVSTDYTEIMVIKDTTKSWKMALYLPLFTVPQVIAVAWVLNNVG
ncbi:permease [Saccharophagus degradans]|uniref:Permease n=1 Tax=Saccharophagus degradans (strain 2-40 / ATCC 43961 / DSM 17024) TaxID=203122 RepID=Q21DP2_SACD2|nr:permease [Saccharophagus degradans]ABD83187.1 permease [Saccharophagus degradans 2-40]